MNVHSILGVIQQSNVATIGTISFLTAPTLAAVTLVKFRFGNLRLAQGRKKRLPILRGRSTSQSHQAVTESRLPDQQPAASLDLRET